jgi:hypothetical protein
MGNEGKTAIREIVASGRDDRSATVSIALQNDARRIVETTKYGYAGALARRCAA